MSIIGSAFQTTQLHCFLVSVDGGRWIVTEMDDGWVEVLAVDSMCRLCGPGLQKKRSPTERDKESYSQGAAAGTPLALPLSLSIGFHMIRGLAWRLLSIPLLKSPSP